MKNIIPLILVCLVITSPVFAQKKKTDCEERDLKGKVKSIKLSGSIRYKNSGTWTKWTNSTPETSLFNDSGKVTEEYFYNVNKSLSYKRNYTYEPQVKEVNSFDADGKRTAKTVYKLDTLGNVIEEIQYNADGSPSINYTFKYNEKGNPIERTAQKADGSMPESQRWKYDSDDNMIESTGLWSAYTYTYDEQGNRIGENFFMPLGNLKLTKTFSYDDKGNKIEENKYNAGEELKEHNIWKYEYDKAGNWIKKIQSSEGEDFSIEERVIEYF